ncbi:DUF2785 domain-containing protein [Tengunoibacter tsumagoiensis]|nr:DUF2785 domain-containing protein [Tengunoibacter tsumagoiensis]
MEKDFWRSIAHNDYQLLEGLTIEGLTPELLSKLGTADPELRDYYIYTTLEKWIERGLYTPEQLRELLTQLLQNLGEGLGEQGDDRVFLRSFSALTISEILKYEQSHHFLRKDEVQALLEQSITYLVREQDLRGYVSGKGWAHAVAHSGDLLGVLARNRHVQTRELERIVTAIAEKMTFPVEYVYTTLDEERLALAVIAVLTRGLLPASYWRWWCRPLLEVEAALHWEDTPNFARQEEICAYHNTRTFLRSLYFQLTLAGYQLPGAQELITAIIKTLRELDPGFYSVDVMTIIDPTLNIDDLRP